MAPPCGREADYRILAWASGALSLSCPCSVFSLLCSSMIFWPYADEDASLMFYSCLISDSGLKAFPLPLHPSDHNARHRGICQSSPMTVPGVRVRTIERIIRPLLEENSDFSQEPRPGELQVQGLQDTRREHWPQSTRGLYASHRRCPHPPDSTVRLVLETPVELVPRALSEM